ncbi:hypothetical protein KM043_006890 [Ampulex compressa]|nr:hypothetical protein KM043_006890 [Ampulex compressa]
MTDGSESPRNSERRFFSPSGVNYRRDNQSSKPTQYPESLSTAASITRRHYPANTLGDFPKPPLEEFKARVYSQPGEYFPVKLTISINSAALVGIALRPAEEKKIK